MKKSQSKIFKYDKFLTSYAVNGKVDMRKNISTQQLF